jgi:hypothetical protein
LVPNGRQYRPTSQSKRSSSLRREWSRHILKEFDASLVNGEFPRISGLNPVPKGDHALKNDRILSSSDIFVKHWWDARSRMRSLDCKGDLGKRAKCGNWQELCMCGIYKRWKMGYGLLLERGCKLICRLLCNPVQSCDERCLAHHEANNTFRIVVLCVCVCVYLTSVRSTWSSHVS